MGVIVKQKVIRGLNDNPVNAHLIGAWPVFEGGGDSVYGVGPCREVGVRNTATWQTSIYGNSLSFNGADGRIQIPSCDAIDNIFAGGGSVSVITKPSDEGEGNNGRILSKNDAAGWILYVGTFAGGSDGLLFLHDFSGGIAYWTIDAVFTGYTDTFQIGVTYDNSSTANNPIFFINGKAFNPTEQVSPSGTAESDAGVDLYVGNNSAATRTFEGLIENVMVYDKVIPEKTMMEISRNPYGGYSEYVDNGWMYEPAVAAGNLLTNTSMDGLGGHYFNPSMNGGINA